MDQIARRVDSPEPGYYQARLCKGGPFVPAAVTITDPSIVPNEYRVIDTAKIKQAARAGTSIPGVTVKPTTQFIVKG